MNSPKIIDKHLCRSFVSNKDTKTFVYYLIPKMTRDQYKHLADYGFKPGVYASLCPSCWCEISGMSPDSTYCMWCANEAYQKHRNAVIDLSVFEYAERVSKHCGNTKEDLSDVLMSLMEEVGELAVEIKIDKGLKQSEHGPDGIVGEAIDVMICALDIIRITKGDLDEYDLNVQFKKKLDKWKRKHDAISVQKTV